MCMRFAHGRFFLLNCTQSVCIGEIAPFRLLPDFSASIIRRAIIDRTFQYAMREIFGKTHQISNINLIYVKFSCKTL